MKHINPLKIHPERITQSDRKLGNDFDYDRIKFHVDKKDFNKIETKNNICINVYCNEKKLTFLIHISDQTFKNSMDFLLLIDENKSHYVYIKDFDRLMFYKAKNKNKKYFNKS